MDEIFKAAQALSAAELDELISALGKVRAAREPAVPHDIPYDTTVDMIPDPKFWLQLEPGAGGGSLIGLRHPGFGILWFMFPPQERARIVEFMQKQIDDQQASLKAMN